MILTIVLIAVACWIVFILDAYVVTKPPRRRSGFVMPSKEDLEDLLYTLPREWVRRARERVRHDDD